MYLPFKFFASFYVVAEIDGVNYYNDSKSTNIDSVLHAVALFPSQVVLLVGGVDKGASYKPWIEKFQGKVKKVIAFGQAAKKMEEELAASCVFQKVDTMAEAIQVAKQNASINETVLLSPGCSSFDQFRDYIERGEEFKRQVQELSTKENS